MMDGKREQRPRPYVGASGIMSRTEAAAAMAFFEGAWRDVGRPPTHDLMVGVLVSEKTLRGEANRYPRRYPARENVHRIFRKDARALNLVHVATGDLHGRDMVAALVAAVAWSAPRARPGDDGRCPACGTLIAAGAEACSSCVDLCDGVQVNAAWPDVVDLHEFRWACAQAHGDRKFRVVLQIGPRALEEVGWDARRLLERVAMYAEPGDELATDVLIDWSAGTGSAPRRSVEEIAHAVDRLLERFPTIGVGIAGGLSAKTIGGYARVLMGRTPASVGAVSTDAESCLRDGAEGGGDLSEPELEAYLRTTVQTVSASRSA